MREQPVLATDSCIGGVGGICFAFQRTDKVRMDDIVSAISSCSGAVQDTLRFAWRWVTPFSRNSRKVVGMSSLELGSNFLEYIVASSARWIQGHRLGYANF